MALTHEATSKSSWPQTGACACVCARVCAAFLKQTFNRPDTLDPGLLRPGRLDRKVEFGQTWRAAHIFKIHTRSTSVERDIRYELLARLCPNSTGADLRSVCTEAGMFAIRARRKVHPMHMHTGTTQHTRTHTYMHTDIHAHAHTYRPTYIHAHTYTHTTLDPSLPQIATEKDFWMR